MIFKTSNTLINTDTNYSSSGIEESRPYTSLKIIDIL